MILVAGVNGTGKTTTSASSPGTSASELGHTVVLAAADTFRAAAVEQLELWAQRAGAAFVKGAPAPTPARSPSRRSPPRAATAPTW